MSEYVIKFAFKGDDMQATAILDHLYQAFTELPDIGAFESVGVVIVPGETLSQSDEQADMEFNNAIDELDSAGIDIDPTH